MQHSKYLLPDAPNHAQIRLRRAGSCGAVELGLPTQFSSGLAQEADKPPPCHRDTAHIEVIDAGPGVPPAQLDQIFDRYFSARWSGKESDAAPGSFGIGLSIARRYVEAMQGTIEAENRAPQGLTIHIRLPVAPRVRRIGPGGDDG